MPQRKLLMWPSCDQFHVTFTVKTSWWPRAPHKGCIWSPRWCLTNLHQYLWRTLAISSPLKCWRRILEWTLYQVECSLTSSSTHKLLLSGSCQVCWLMWCWFVFKRVLVKKKKKKKKKIWVNMWRKLWQKFSWSQNVSTYPLRTNVVEMSFVTLTSKWCYLSVKTDVLMLLRRHDVIGTSKRHYYGVVCLLGTVHRQRVM